MHSGTGHLNRVVHGLLSACKSALTLAAQPELQRACASARRPQQLMPAGRTTAALEMSQIWISPLDTPRARKVPRWLQPTLHMVSCVSGSPGMVPRSHSLVTYRRPQVQQPGAEIATEGAGQQPKASAVCAPAAPNMSRSSCWALSLQSSY